MTQVKVGDSVIFSDEVIKQKPELLSWSAKVMGFLPRFPSLLEVRQGGIEEIVLAHKVVKIAS